MVKCAITYLCAYSTFEKLQFEYCRLRYMGYFCNVNNKIYQLNASTSILLFKYCIAMMMTDIERES